MNHRRSLSVLTLFLSCTLLLTSGCSETTKEAPPLDEIIFPVSFPYIENSSLYSIESDSHFGLAAEEGDSLDASEIPEYKLLFDAPSGLILALDTDQSTKSTEDGVDAFEHTFMPEYIAYAKAQTLHIYDLNTRHDHQVFSFEQDEFFEPSEANDQSLPNFICDIQKVITWDEDSRLSKRELFKDELAVYVKTSSADDCTEPDDGFQFWQINIEESTKKRDEFTIRRKVLKEHTHEHRHFHDHDNPDDELFDKHSHQHALEKDEFDEDSQEFFDPNDHKHKHKHSHEFIYGPEHEHEQISQAEIDAVHNDPKNHEVKFETHKGLFGKKTTITSIDEALMYSGTPVIDLAAMEFGYLGLNSKENAYKFYQVNLDTLEKRLLWTLTSEHFTDLINTHSSLVDWRALVPKYSRPASFQTLNGNIGIYANQKLFYFPIESLFDDDASEIREQILANPLFSSSISSPALNERTHYNQANKIMSIIEDNQIWLIDFNETPALAILWKTINESNLDSLEAHMMQSGVLTVKRFTENDIPMFSITAIQSDGLENRTIIPRSSNKITLTYLQGEAFANIIDQTDQTLKARHLPNTSGTLPPELLNTLWVEESLDYRNNTETKIISQLSSDFLNSIPETIEQPGLYILNKNEPNRRGEFIMEVSESVKHATGLVIFNKFYSLLEYRNSENTITTQSKINTY